jgi:lysozyme
MTALKVAASLCKQFEGFRAEPYLCPAGVPTIGYGSTYYPDGRKVSLTDPPISQAQAELMLIQGLQGQYMPAVLKLSPSLVAFPNALGAITDFAYNLGAARYRASTLRKRIDSGDWPGAKTEIMRWVRGGGRVLPGLVRRRAAEAELLG